MDVAKYIDRVAPVHGKISCSDSNPSNAGPNGCPRCTLLELESLRQLRELAADTVRMPRELTAENGAKAALIGEFSMVVELTCSACSYHDVDPECEVCGGEINYTQSVPVEWTTVKDVYRAAVRHFHPEPAASEGPELPAGPPLDCQARALREGEVMNAYLEFDRGADRNWTNAEYILKFGEAVSAATAVANTRPAPNK